MGIRGLETYLEKHNPDACYQVRVIHLIHKYRKENNCAPVIVVDGNSVIGYIYKLKNLSWICGGQLKEYEESLKEFINAFQKEGAELVFYFDGPRLCSKQELWIKRRLRDLDKVYKIFDQINKGKTIRALEENDFFLLPSNLRFLTIIVAKHFKCKVYNSIRECDLEIAEYASRYKCMAILAQDTDFVIFEGAKYYLSMKNFNLKYMSTLNYDREKLASSIGLYSTELPLLATLLGNDIVSFQVLEPFHRWLNTKHQRGFKSNWFDFKKLIMEVALFIKKHVHNNEINHQILKCIAKMVFDDASKWEILEQSILSYDYSAKVNRNPGPYSSIDKNFNNLLIKAFERHRVNTMFSINYEVITRQFYSCATCLEDYRLDDLPACQTILKPLREKLYGILLHENSEADQVEELVMCGPQSLDCVLFVKPQNGLD